ncbi:MAG: hypothetical protein HUJ70_00135 [Pseudobutyrivibrio sp.]|nr:hypothetical protein [Pseudobutyrivibrio sp.]MCF0158971.1 hypothetical protein [Veillonella sp.]
MAKNYLTKEEKRNFLLWTKEHANNTLLTSKELADICETYSNNPKRIGEHIIGLVSGTETTENDFDINEEDIFCLG